MSAFFRQNVRRSSAKCPPDSSQHMKFLDLSRPSKEIRIQDYSRKSALLPKGGTDGNEARTRPDSCPRVLSKERLVARSPCPGAGRVCCAPGVPADCGELLRAVCREQTGADTKDSASEAGQPAIVRVPRGGSFPPHENRGHAGTKTGRGNRALFPRVGKDSCCHQQSFCRASEQASSNEP